MSGIKAIAYYRVSTNKQGIIGLGMESQRDSVVKYAAREGYEIIQVFEEVKSGAKRNRRQVQAALAACRVAGAVLLVAKLDRVARDVGFVDKLIKGDVKFICVDMPGATKMMLQMFAIFAEYERDECSKRTKAAATVLRAHGVMLGNKKEKQRGMDRALDYKQRIEDARACGIESVRGLADICGVAPTAMVRILKRLEGAGN
jgi:DNA invertase Pin-like site-specific DNA recombinase